MSDFGGDLDPLIQKFIIQMDPVQATAFKVATEKAVRAAQAAMAKTATDGTSKAMREVTRITIDATRRRYKQQERLALTAGKREGEIVKQTASNAIAIRKQAASRELDVQRRHGEQRAANEKRAMSKWEEVVRRAFFKMKGRYEESARDQERTQTGSQQRQHRSQQQAYKVWYALFEDFLKRRRARERAQQFEDLAAQKAADRKAWEQQRHRNSRDLTEWREHQRRVTNSHKAMWSIIRSTTETGSRFMSSITQSALRSMGNAVGHGFKLITGQYRQGTNRQEAILRDSYADQTRIVTREIARQQGAVASFQATAQRGALGGFMNLRNLALGFGGYLSARALFGSLVDYEQTQVAFENLLGSAQAAQDMLKDLRAFNVATPFELPQIQQAAKQLLAMGETAAEVIPDLQAIGDVGAKFSASSEDVNGVIRALGQMSQSAKVSAQDINQIQQRFVGFNARAAIARGLGISVAEAMEMIASGAISGNEGMNAMIEGMKSEQNAAGAMEEQMRTLGGAISNFTDLLQMLWLDTMVPFLPVLSKAVRTTTMFIDSLAHGRGVWAVVRSGLLGISIALGAIVAQRAAVGIMQLMGTALVNLRLAVVNHPFIAFASVLAVLGTMLYRHNDTFREFVDGFLDPLGAWASSAAGTVLAFFSDLPATLASLPAALSGVNWGNVWETLSESAMAGIASVLRSISSVASGAVEFLRPWGALLVSAVQYGFASLQVWLNSGGVGDLADTLGGAVSDAFNAVRSRLGQLDWGTILRYGLIGIGAAVTAYFLGVPGLIVAALVAGSPRIRDGLAQVIGTAMESLGEFTQRLPALLIGGLYLAAEFLSGPVLATIFGPVGVRIIAALAAAVVAGAGAVFLGLIDGLKQSIPSIIDAVQGLLSDIMQAVSDGLGDLPLIGDLLAAGFTPLEVVLQGIIPTLGLFVDLITLVPTPVLAASAAIFGLVKAWTALSVTARAQGVLSGFTGMLDTIALRTMYAGDAIGRLGTRMTNATAPAIMNGAASRVQIAMRSIGVAAQGAGAAVSAIGAAMPAIGMAAAIGIPVVLGMMQQARQKQKAWRDEINRTANSMLDLQTTAKEVLTETIRDSQAATAALMDAGVSIDQLFTSIKGSAATVGETYSVLAGMSDGLERAGISAEQFGTAVLEGDQAVRTLITTQTRGQATSTETIDLMGNLKDAYAALPDPLRDAADQMAEQAEQMLTNAAVTGQLNAAEQERLATILAMEHPEARLLDMQQDVTDRMTGAKEAADRQAEAYRNMRDRIDEVANSTSLFSDVMDRLTDNALPLTRVRQNIEDAIAAFRELMNDPDASPGEQERAFTDYAEAIRTAANDLVALDRPLGEVTTAYELQRDALLEQLTAFLGSSDAAEDYAETVLGIPPLSETVAEFVVAEANRRVERLEGRLEELGAMSPSPSVDLRTANAQEKLDELKNYLDIVASAPWVAEFHVRVTSDFEEWLQTPAGSGVTPEDMLQLARGYAKGGLVTRPELALIGEAGPELILPLSDPRRMAELLSQHAGAVAGAMPATSASLPGAAISMGAPTVNAEGIAAWIEATAAALAPLGERIAAATTPGMRMWANAVERVLGRILSGFETWGDRMVSLAVSISAAITAGITDGLREGRSEVVRITRGYARSLVGALNPLLTGIGETPIELNFAKGGIAEAHHGAQVHVFNEGRRGRGSSHGEAYIPFDPSNRARSRELAAETARRLGGNVQWFADGGITTPTIQSGQLVPGVTGDVVGLVAEFARRLSTWSLANGGGYHVGSGYRSIEEQTRLYQRYLAGVPGQAPAAPPGRSMHNFGLASDGNHWRNLRPEEFGLRFPMSYEPWHVEPAEGRALLGDTDFPSFQPLPRPPEAGQRGWLSQVAAKLMAYVYDKTLAYAGGLSYSGTAPTLGSASASPAILAAIRQAMGIVGVPASWLGPLLTLISRESSFNPNAYNSILGASGLMQVIPSTFAAYALPGYGGIFNPVANVIAGLRYILARYGTIFNVGQATSPTPTRGYSYGGIVERDGLYRLAEGNRREAILPLDNPGRTNEILRRLGLLPDDGDQRVTVDSLRPDSAASRNAATLAPVVGEMNVYSNAMDPEIVASLAAAKVNRVVARVRG